MQRLGVDPYMDATRRNDILLQIAGARAKEMRILEILQSIPAWADRPFQKDQENFDASFKAYQAANPVVRNIESRLVTAPGPIWRDLTPDEQAALSSWMKSVDQLYAYVNTYFPTETQQYVAQVALLAIALGAFIAPIFLDEPEKGLSLPFGLEPPKFPSSPRPVRRPAPTQAIMPTSISRIPQPTGPVGPLRVQPEIMRPAAATPMPWRKSPAAATPMPWRESPTAPATPGYRTFTRPLGPETSTSRIPTPSQAATTPSVPPGHGPPTFPRFRRQ